MQTIWSDDTSICCFSPLLCENKGPVITRQNILTGSVARQAKMLFLKQNIYLFTYPASDHSYVILGTLHSNIPDPPRSELVVGIQAFKRTHLFKCI